MKSPTKRIFLMAFVTIFALCAVFSLTIGATQVAHAAENDLTIVSSYSFAKTEASEAEFARKSNHSDIIEYYNIYDGDIKISETTIPESRKSIERNTAGFIPGNITEFPTKSIIGSDERTKVTSTTTFPYSAICYIRITFPDGVVFIGSAWMYWSDIAITAGHCVYDSNHGGWASTIEVIPGANGSSKPFGTAWSSTMHTSTKWINDGNHEYDYALLELNTQIGNSTGYFGTHYTFWSLKNKGVTVTGYPGEYYREQWTMSGKIKRSSIRKVYYEIDTTGGQSGCPVYWHTSKYGYQSVAIHAYGGSSENSGTRITSSMFDFFSSFRD